MSQTFPDRADPDTAMDFPQRVLLVEDSMLIAMDVEDMLTALGAATVLAAASVSEARDLIDDPAIDFAILDLNLDGETSLPIAEILAGRGIPFVFASGYGDQAGVTGAFPGVSVITKPYGHDEIVAAWRDIAR